MAYDLESARVRIGLMPDDSSKDSQINTAMGGALSFAERYCNRQFIKKTESVKFVHFFNNNLQLSRYPIESVIKISSGTSQISSFHVDEKLGVLTFENNICSHELIVDYTGGYEVLPADLEMALWRLFDSCWAIMGGSGGATGGVIKAISSAGARVEYDVKSSASSGAGANGVSDPFAESILDLYRVESC